MKIGGKYGLLEQIMSLHQVSILLNISWANSIANLGYNSQSDKAYYLQARDISAILHKNTHKIIKSTNEYRIQIYYTSNMR